MLPLLATNGFIHSFIHSFIRLFTCISQPLSEEEIELATNQRKLWAAHLHPLHEELESIIGVLAGSSCQPLIHVFRRVCAQVADLAAPSALHIVR